MGRASGVQLVNLGASGIIHSGIGSSEPPSCDPVTLSSGGGGGAPPYVNASCLLFNGSTGLVKGSYRAAQNPATDFTINAWVKGAAVTDGAVIAAMYNDTPPKNYLFARGATNGAKLALIISDGTNQKYYESSTTVFDSTWHMITMTFGSSTLKLYVDGNLDTPNKIIDGAMSSINNTAIPLQSGPRPAGGSNIAYYNGRITNLSLWSAALSGAQVTSLASSSKPVDLSTLGIYSNIISWYKYGDGDATGANGVVDSSSNAYHMTISGGVTIDSDHP